MLWSLGHKYISTHCSVHILFSFSIFVLGKCPSLKNTFLFFLCHLAFILFQGSLQVLVFLFSSVSKHKQEIKIQRSCLGTQEKATCTMTCAVRELHQSSSKLSQPHTQNT